MMPDINLHLNAMNELFKDVTYDGTKRSFVCGDLDKLTDQSHKQNYKKQILLKRKS